ncbi:hypothetical protein BC938DRAFT_470660 [Jimgerdemannia flammicorona]|uniref:Uncharacterized protein n=1 Tax=Jimgerdemannia flammicorona TaxID=994334 RepID=A0A433Q9Q6_9FUNG|nr:hypothetical protein BC938DRAFT_470660 [Jimgerdemannia flammicorona]
MGVKFVKYQGAEGEIGEVRDSRHTRFPLLECIRDRDELYRIRQNSELEDGKTTIEMLNKGTMARCRVMAIKQSTYANPQRHGWNGTNLKRYLKSATWSHNLKSDASWTSECHRQVNTSECHQSTFEPSTSISAAAATNRRQNGHASRAILKRTPQCPATVPTDIYVSRKSTFGAQLARAKKNFFVEG